MAPGRVAGQPARVARPGGAPADDRPPARGDRAAAPGGDRGHPGAARQVRRPGRRRATRTGGRRHAHAPVPVLPPRPHPGRADPADAARGRRPDHTGDREGVPGARGHHGETDHPGQAADRPGGFPDAHARRARRAGARRAPRAVPDLQRRLFEHQRPGPAAGRTDGRGDPPGPRTAPTAARRPRGDRLAGAPAPHRRPPARTYGSGGRAGPHGRAGPVPVGQRADRRRGGAGERVAGGHPAVRAVPAPGGDRRRPRRGTLRRGHRLAADPRAVRAAGRRHRQPGRGAEPGGGGVEGARAGGRAGGVGPGDGRRPVPGDGRTRPPTRRGRRPARRPELYLETAKVTTSLPERRYLARTTATRRR